MVLWDMEYMEYQKSMVLATKHRAGKPSLFTVSLEAFSLLLKDAKGKNKHKLNPNTIY